MSTIKETSHPEMGFAEQEVYIYITVHVLQQQKSSFYVVNYLTKHLHMLCAETSKTAGMHYPICDTWCCTQIMMQHLGKKF